MMLRKTKTKKKLLIVMINLVDSHGTIILMMMDRTHLHTGSYLKTLKEPVMMRQKRPQVRLETTKEFATVRVQL